MALQASPEVFAWLRAAPDTEVRDQSLAILVRLAQVIAEHLGCDTPDALRETEGQLLSSHEAWVHAAPPEQLGPELLGIVWEVLQHPGDRRSRGAHFTPRHLAESVCAAAFSRLPDTDVIPTVLDPAVGGGAFVLAAARGLEDRGLSRGGWGRADIVSNISGVDIDPISVKVADAALQLWSGGEARPTMTVADLLAADWPQMGAFDVLIGNPPFLGQLSADTARGEARRAELRGRFGDSVTGYVDEALLFVLASAALIALGGVVAMILPQSVLGATDGTTARTKLDEQLDLVALWVEQGQPFGAAVDVVAAIFVRQPRTETTTVMSAEAPHVMAPTPPPTSWAPLLGIASGVPNVELKGASTLGSYASITAGFRQHFYGIAEAVGQRSGDETMKLVTAGAIEPLWLRWGDRPAKFAGRKWLEPTLDLAKIDDGAVREWFSARKRPKVLVATQTRVVEVVVDATGQLAPSVPVISVEPNDPENTWRVAAMLSAPAVSAFIAQQSHGTGLSSDSVRVRAKALAALPLPLDSALWGQGAYIARLVHAAAEAHDWSAYRETLLALGRQMNAAYEADETSVAWWQSRLRFPSC